MGKSLVAFLQNNKIEAEIVVPGDKSISHRALIFSALANGVSKISGLLEGEDILRTVESLRMMGVEINKVLDVWQINGVGIAGLREADNVLYMGNSGTSTRLLIGLVSTLGFTTFFTGDASIRKRPMGRIFDPIKKFGAKVISTASNNLPVAIIGAKEAIAIDYKMTIASAQQKTALMLAALNASGTTNIIEPNKCRNHTEIMAKYLGIDITTEEINAGSGTKISVNSSYGFDANNFSIPGDISSAAFIIVATLIIPGSKVRINNVGLNPTRDGIIKVLKNMGGNINISNVRTNLGEKIVDLEIEYSKLKGVVVDSSLAPFMIDEYPILAVAASHAEGVTIMKGLEELKVKESNRFNAIIEGIAKCGVKVSSDFQEITIVGGINMPIDIVEIKTNLDHRIAMSFLIMGFTLKNGLRIDDYSVIDTSFPEFIKIFIKFGFSFKKDL